jgi:hypothetical protein
VEAGCGCARPTAAISAVCGLFGCDRVPGVVRVPNADPIAAPREARAASAGPHLLPEGGAATRKCRFLVRGCVSCDERHARFAWKPALSASLLLFHRCRSSARADRAPAYDWMSSNAIASPVGGRAIAWRRIRESEFPHPPTPGSATRAPWCESFGPGRGSKGGISAGGAIESSRVLPASTASGRDRPGRPARPGGGQEVQR